MNNLLTRERLGTGPVPAGPAPESPARRPGQLGWRNPRILVPAVLAVYFLVSLVRRPTAWSQPTIWAEDGREFIGDALSPGMDMFTPYVGQLWLVQRAIAWPISEAPATTWPVLLWVASAIGMTLAASVVLLPRAADLLGPLPLRALAGLLIVLLPGTWEVHGNVANLHWWGAAAALVLLSLRPPGSGLGRVGELAVLVFLGLSGTTAVLVVPVAMWALVKYRSRYVILRSLLMLAMAAIALALSASGTSRVASLDPLNSGLDVMRFVGVRIGGVWLVGERGLAFGWDRPNAMLLLGLAAVALLTVVLILAVSDLRGPSLAWLLSGVLAVAGGIMALSAAERSEALTPYLAGRYASLGLIATALVVVRALYLRRGLLRGMAVGALAAMCVGMAADLVLPTMGNEVDPAALAAFDVCVDRASSDPDVACELATVPDTGDWRISYPTRPRG